MKVWVQSACFAALWLLASVPALAQPPVAWWENPVANGLTLSDVQKERINGILRDHRDALTSARDAAERAEQDLDTIYNAEAIDWARARAAIDQLVKARADLTQNLARMTLRLRAVLTIDQWRTLQGRGATGRAGKGRGPGPANRGRPPRPPATSEVH